MRDRKPLVKRNLGTLIERAYGDRERLAAGIHWCRAGARVVLPCMRVALPVSRQCGQPGPCGQTRASSQARAAASSLKIGFVRLDTPFKRNDELLQTMPIGIILFPGSGITENLADKAKVLGIPVWRFGGGG